MSERHSRRDVLRVGAAALAASTTPLLAGCSGGSASDGAPTDGADGGGDSTPTPTEAESGGDGGGSNWQETSTVKMPDNLKFEPKRIQVSAGTTVTWENTGSIGHTVTAYEDEIPDGAAYFASGGFDSEQAAKDGYSDGQEGNVPAGESYEHTFETKGTYKYYCIPHEMNGMVGFVKVV